MKIFLTSHPALGYKCSKIPVNYVRHHVANFTNSTIFMCLLQQLSKNKHFFSSNSQIRFKVNGEVSLVLNEVPHHEDVLRGTR